MKEKKLPSTSESYPVKRSSERMYSKISSQASGILSEDVQVPYESVLREAKETALKEMSDHAARMGANAVIAVDLDYETVGGSGSGSMLMVTAAGTAVRYQ